MNTVYQHHDLLALVAQQINDLVVVVGLDGEIIYISPSVRCMGYDPIDLIGQPSAPLIHPDDRQRAMANTAAVLRGAPLPSFKDRQNRYRRACGDWVWMEGFPSLFLDAEGNAAGVVNILRDVTEHRHHADLFEAAFRHAANGMALTTLDDRFVRVNAALCRMTGYSEQDLLANGVPAIVNPAEAEVDPAQMAQLLSGEIESLTLSRSYRRADAGVVPTTLTLSMVRTPDGAPLYYVAQVLDLTQQQVAEHNLRAVQERYKIIAENTSDIIVMSDMAGRIQYVSAALEDMGYSRPELIGRESRDLIYPEDLPALRREFAKLLTNGVCDRVRLRVHDKNRGGWRWMESSPRLLRDPLSGEPTGFLDVVRDINDQVAQEDQLRDARAKAEAATEAKSQFLANMSHEIRTPLTAILGFTSLLREASSLSGEAATYVQRIGSAGTALLSIVNDILDHAKLEAGRLEIRAEPTDVGALARETLGLFELQAEDKGLRLVLDVDPTITGRFLVDPDRLRQILINLVGNAVKFTDHGSVSLGVRSGGADTMHFAVADTGPGLDAEQQASLFQRFSQVDPSSTRRVGGAGLGLAICQGLAEAMQGAINLTSVPGEGSVFEVVVPAPRALQPARPDVDAAMPSLDGLRILVVDDTSANRALAAHQLRALGAEVTVAEGGEAAMAVLAACPMDTALLDLQMPGLGGCEILSRLRAASGPNREIPVLAFSAYGDDPGADLSAFDGVVCKPFSLKALATAIAQALDIPLEEGRHAKAV